MASQGQHAKSVFINHFWRKSRAKADSNQRLRLRLRTETSTLPSGQTGFAAFSSLNTRWPQKLMSLLSIPFVKSSFEKAKIDLHFLITAKSYVSDNFWQVMFLTTSWMKREGNSLFIQLIVPRNLILFTDEMVCVMHNESKFCLEEKWKYTPVLIILRNVTGFWWSAFCFKLHIVNSSYSQCWIRANARGYYNTGSYMACQRRAILPVLGLNLPLEPFLVKKNERIL